MKCTNCGHELEPGSGFCQHCGMIMSLDEPQNEKENPSKALDDSFGYIEQNQPETQEKISSAFEGESAEEPVAQDGETAEAVFEDISSGVPLQDEPEKNEQESAPEENASVFEDGETHALFQAEAEKDEEEESSPSLQQSEQSEAASVPVPETSEPENDNEPEEEFDEMLVSSKGKGKKGSVIVAVLVVALVAVIAGGVTVIKGNFKVPVNVSTNESTVSQDSNAVDPTTKKEETTKEETTEKETTEKEETTKEEKTTKDEKATTKAEATSSSRPSSASTTAARTTAATTRGASRPYSTTKAQTTSRAQTTSKAQTTTKRASTTAKPTTTNSSSTSNQYDVVSVKPQKPSSYLSNSYTGYVTVNGVHMRSGPSASSSHILYFSIGADVKVLASQNGFLYVYSNRYGVYGWINAANVSKTRPQSSSETIVPNLVKPDKTYSSQKTMYVNTKSGLRLRKGPGSNYDVIRMLSNGYPVTVKGYSSKNSGWVYVTDTTHGISGWVSSAYLK